MLHDAIMKTFTFGVCLPQGDCTSNADPPDLPRFDMKQLQSPLAWAAVGWKERLSKLVQSNATILLFVVITIESTRFCTFVFLLIQTSMLHGWQVAPAVTYSVLCSVCHKSR